MQIKPFPLIVALFSGAASLTLAMHYPLVPTVMIAVVLVCWAVFFARPGLWLLVLPALLPVIGLAPWSGWITFEELDIFVLAVAAGGYARVAWFGANAKTSKPICHHYGLNLLMVVWLLAALYTLSVFGGMYRGFIDAGGFRFGWFQGYHEPMNSVRVGKSFFLALLLLPLWWAASRQDAERSQRLLSLGLMLGLAVAALTTVWERAAFVDLMNFSADYRTTGMFWEMHVGGAALDGFLALTVPFALHALVRARTPMRWGLAAAVLGLAAYACLTTFSRGVYLAVPVGLLVFFWLSRGHDPSRTDRPGWVAGLLLVAGFAVGAAWLFQSSGYRGVAALLGTVAMLLPMPQVLRGFGAKQWALGAVAGMLLTLVAVAVTALVPKGAYVAWVLAAVFTAAMLWAGRRATLATSLFGAAALGGFLTMLASTAFVANHWGESAGLRHSIPVLLAVLGVCAVAGLRQVPLWPQALRWQAAVLGAMGFVAITLGVMGGGAYMSDRFSTGGQDMEARLAHWQLGRNMLTTPADWWFGKGLGRFPSNYFLAGDIAQHPGDYRLKTEGDNSYLTLTGGLHTNGWGELFRVSQRVAEPGEGAIVTARVRAAKDIHLHFEVCEKHLLYNQGCMIKQIGIKGMPGVWQEARAALDGSATRGDWYAPRLLAFSMAVETRGGSADMSNVTLTSADGRPLLVNGDFSDGMARWFFSSDRNHLPWHIKSLYMNVLFDMGAVGLTLWLLLFSAALWRVSMGPARTQPLAPALAAALVGFAVVGLFDSLLDVPRVAWLYYLLLLVALTLPAARVQRGLP